MHDFLTALDRMTTSTPGQRLRSAVHGLSNLLLPNPCALCVWAEAAAQHLCTTCAELLKHQTRQVLQAQDFAEALPLDLVTGQPLPVFSAGLYTAEMSTVVLQFKDHQRIGLGSFFRPVIYRTMQRAVEQLGQPYYRLVPIPAGQASLRQRGYNPVEVLLPKPLPPQTVVDTGLIRSRWWRRAASTHRGKAGAQLRRTAARDKFRLIKRHRPPAEPLILVDDVLTTGATLAAATRTLQAAGFDVAGAVVLAAVPPRG